MFNKTFDGRHVKLDHGITIVLYDTILVDLRIRRLVWMVEDSLGNSQLPTIHRELEDGYITIYWDAPERISRSQKDRLRQLAEDFPSIGRMHMPFGENPRIYKMFSDDRECWIHSVRQETHLGPAVQHFIYDVENDLVSARFRIAWENS